MPKVTIVLGRDEPNVSAVTTPTSPLVELRAVDARSSGIVVDCSGGAGVADLPAGDYDVTPHWRTGGRRRIRVTGPAALHRIPTLVVDPPTAAAPSPSISRSRWQQRNTNGDPS